MRAIERIKAFFKRGKAAEKVEAKPNVSSSEAKTTEATRQEGARK